MAILYIKYVVSFASQINFIISLLRTSAKNQKKISESKLLMLGQDTDMLLFFFFFPPDLWYEPAGGKKKKDIQFLLFIF